jgi:hypothetical protein
MKWCGYGRKSVDLLKFLLGGRRITSTTDLKERTLLVFNGKKAETLQTL